MDTSLATNGLGELVLQATAVETVGGNVDAVMAACENLTKHATNMEGFMDELKSEMNLVLSDWEGQAADRLEEMFPSLLQAFGEIPGAITSIANWASTTMQNYATIDEKTASAMGEILGGGN